MKNKIVVTGGELLNKGAQSMTFNVVNQLKKKFPDKEIIIFSTNDYYRLKSDTNPYTFRLFPHKAGAILNLFMPFSVVRKIETMELTNELKEILNDTYLNIDISGFKLSSQFNNPSSDLIYLLTRKVMDKFGIKQYIFPQSFGPFNYKQPWKLILTPFFKYMKLPEIVFAREEQGYDFIKKYTQDNLKRAHDSVLSSEEIELTNIFRDVPVQVAHEVKPNTVGIVPNAQLLKHNENNNIVKVYKNLIDEILLNDNEVVIFRHSIEDLEFCKLIKNEFTDNERVVLIEDDMNCFELRHLISKLKYLVGSRYHSVVHAYQEVIPVLIIGWSYKYKELAESFKQEDLLFDIRQDLDEKDIKTAINLLENNLSVYSQSIQVQIETVRKENLFNIIK